MGSPTLQILQDLILLLPWFGVQVSKLGFGAPLQTSSTRGGRGEREGRTKLSRYTALNPATRNRFLGSCRPLQRIVEPCARVVHVRGELNVQYLLLLPGSEILAHKPCHHHHHRQVVTQAAWPPAPLHLACAATWRAARPPLARAATSLCHPDHPMPQRTIKPHAEHSHSAPRSSHDL